MAWNKGFNFRDTSGYVTDGANESPVIAEAYPHTYSNGATAGWADITIINALNRDNTLDRRLAGINYFTNGGVSPSMTFQIDLPAAGTYNVQLALGDASATHNGSSVIIKDGSTTLLTIGPHTETTAKFWDATDTEYTAAAWPGSQLASGPLTFTGTTLNVELHCAPGEASTIAHIFVSQLSTAYKVQSKSAGFDGATSGTVTFTSSITTGNTVLVAITSYYADSANSPQSYSVSDNKTGNIYTRVVNLQGPGGGGGTGAYEIYEAPNVNGGSSFTVTVGTNGAAAYFEIIAIEYSGLVNTGAFDVSSSLQTASGGGTYTSNAATTTQASELLIGVFSTYATAPTVTPDTGWAMVDSNHNSFNYGSVQEQFVSATGSYANTGSISGGATWDSVIIATFKAAGAAPPTPPTMGYLKPNHLRPRLFAPGLAR